MKAASRDSSPRPVVSVITPIHNTPFDYLTECVESILAQSYGQLEVILVDDGSDEGVAHRCDEVAEQDERISVVHLPPSGVAAARNTGIELSTGDYLVFVDSDDALARDAVSTMVEEIERSQADISVFSYQVIEDGKTRDESFFVPECRSFSEMDESMRRMLVSSCMVPTAISNMAACTNVGVPWAKIYSSAFVKRHGIRFQPGLKMMEDSFFNMHAFIRTEAVSCKDERVYTYRRSRYSVTKSYAPDFERTAATILQVFREFIDDYDAPWLEPIRKTKNWKLFCDWLKLSACHPEFKKTLPGRARLIRKTFNSWGGDYFSELDTSTFSKVEHAVYPLAKLHWWLAIATLLTTHNRIKDRSK